MKLKKYLLSVFAIAMLSSAFAELPKIENTAESISNAFQSLISNIKNPFENVDYHIAEDLLKAYSFQLENLTYEKVQDYIAEIDNAMKELERSGVLSKTSLENFKHKMENAYCDLGSFRVPDSVSLNYDDDPNIKILNQNAEAYKKRIADCEKRLEKLSASDSRRKTLRDTIRSDTSNLDSTYSKIEQYKKHIEYNYKKELAQKVRAFSTWKDFFDGKNTVIKEFLELINTKKRTQQSFDELVPMKDTKLYQPKLDAFISGWGL